MPQADPPMAENPKQATKFKDRESAYGYDKRKN